MHRRLILAIPLALALLLLPAAGPVAAHNNSCQDITTQNLHTSNLINGGSSFSGIRSDIDPSTIVPGPEGFLACNDSNGLDLVGASMAWVAIEPGPDNLYYGITSAILQIGVINCDDLGVTVCDPQGSQGLHYFWAHGGCGVLNQPTPNPIGNNPNVSTISRNYAVYRSYATPTVYNYVLSINGASTIVDPATDTEISCWINSPSLQFEVGGERKDNGDDFGSSSDPTKFLNNQRRTNGVSGLWSNVNVGSCEYENGDTGCILPGAFPNSFYIETLGG